MRASRDKATRPGYTPVASTFLGLEAALKSYLMRFLVSSQDIEDVVQETFLRAYVAEKKEEVALPKSFLFKIARNCALSELSRKSNRMRVYLGDLQDLAVIDDRPAVEDEVETQRRLEIFCSIAATLPPQCRRVLVMRKVFGFSRKEISRHLNISVKTVENHLTRALKLCAHSMERHSTTRNIEPPEYTLDAIDQ